MKAKTIGLSCAIAAGLVAQAFGSAATQAILDGITLNPAGNSGATLLNEGDDHLWAVGGSGGSFQVLFTRNASFPNTFGIYEAGNPGNAVQVFSGGDAIGAQKLVSMDFMGNVYVNFVQVATFGQNCFGFFSNNSGGRGGDTWYSQTSLNSDGVDHMEAWQGNGTDTIQLHPLAVPGVWGQNEYAIFFEDIAGGGDLDYDDIGVFVESVSNKTPDGGATVLLLGAALSALGLLRRKIAR
jgi:hypothetical protein